MEREIKIKNVCWSGVCVHACIHNPTVLSMTGSQGGNWGDCHAGKHCGGQAVNEDNPSTPRSAFWTLLHHCCLSWLISLLDPVQFCTTVALSGPSYIVPSMVVVEPKWWNIWVQFDIMAAWLCHLELISMRAKHLSLQFSEALHNLERYMMCGELHVLDIEIKENFPVSCATCNNGSVFCNWPFLAFIGSALSEPCGSIAFITSKKVMIFLLCVFVIGELVIQSLKELK